MTAARSDPSAARRFEALFRPHMRAAYNLARHLTGEDAAAQDVVQEAYLRAFRFLDRFAGVHERAWLLAIVRNQAYSHLAATGRRGEQVAIGDELAEDSPVLGHEATPERLALERESRDIVRRAVAALPLEYREVVVLRDLEDMSYKEIATIAGLPIGTVMSRLARGRERLRGELIRRRA